MILRVRFTLLAALSAACFLLLAGPAAAAPSPWWHLTQRLIPTRLNPEGEGTLVVQAIDLGNRPTSGGYELTATLPAGLVLQDAEFFAPMPEVFAGPSRDLGPGGPFASEEYCQATAITIACSSESASHPGQAGYFTGPLPPYGLLEMRLQVKAEPGAESGLGQLSVNGGGASPVDLERAVPIGEEPIGFGAEHFSLLPEEEGGAPAATAGSHPYQLTTDFSFNRSKAEPIEPPALARDLHFKLPAGQIGNAIVTPRCSDADFAHPLKGGLVNACPPDTQLGATIVTASIAKGKEQNFTVPVFNLAPAYGEPARFGFVIVHNPIILDTSVRSGPGEDYGVNVDIHNITQTANFISSTTTFWGTPADPSHDESRGWGCIDGGVYDESSGLTCTSQTVAKPPAFLTLPTDCAAPFVPHVDGDSWPTLAAPSGFSFPDLESDGSLSLVGCNQVPFAPTTDSEPTSDAATSPTGLGFDINVNDEGLTSSKPDARVQSQIKKTVVTLPEGFTTNPSVAEGLKACTEAQYEAETVESPPGAGCPNESNVGSVEVESPLVAQKLTGALYVAKQGENPYHNLLTLYLVARNPEIGIIVKQALKVTPDPLTGQLTTEVDNIPELPFSHFHLAFRQGQRSPLVTPPACGTYAVEAELYPWSEPDNPVPGESSFKITQGPEGLPCPSGGLPPFHPGLEAGTINNAAGTYSPFYTHITRRDSEQEITHFSIKLPPGIAGILAGIPYCNDAQIAQAKSLEIEGGGTIEEANPSCPAASQLGRSLVGSGVGNVLAYAPGKIYLAGPYHGSNLSMVSITAAKVGPFDLGTVVVRFALRIDPETAEVFVDATGSDPIPHIVDGIPVHLRDIRAYVDRPSFTFNPTSCAPTSTASTVLGSGLDFVSAADDVPVTVSSPFQAADCAALPFKPKLKLSLKGNMKRTGAPAFRAELTMRPGEANVGRSVVTLPRSEFLFNAHIANACGIGSFRRTGSCPPGSIYGRARAVTPVFDEPLEGPVYLMGGLGHKLPDLYAVLKNSQAEIHLDGIVSSVQRKKHGEAFSLIRNTFETVPDAPVSKFVLEMFGGDKGLLQNSANLCRGKNSAISEFTAHSGKVFNTKPVVKAASCKSKKRKSKRRYRRHHRRG